MRGTRKANRHSRLWRYRALSLLLGLAAWAARPAGAGADNCSGLGDCYGTVASALAATVGIALVLATVVSLPSILASLESLAARSFGAEGTDEAARAAQAATGVTPPHGGPAPGYPGGVAADARAMTAAQGSPLDAARMPYEGSQAPLPPPEGQTPTGAAFPPPPPPPAPGQGGGPPPFEPGQALAGGEATAPTPGFGAAPAGIGGIAPPPAADAAGGAGFTDLSRGHDAPPPPPPTIPPPSEPASYAGSTDLSRAPAPPSLGDAPTATNLAAPALDSGPAPPGEAATAGATGATDLSRAPLPGAAPQEAAGLPAQPAGQPGATGAPAGGGEAGLSRRSDDLSMAAPREPVTRPEVSFVREMQPDATNLQSGARDLSSSAGAGGASLGDTGASEPAGAGAEAGGAARALGGVGSREAPGSQFDAQTLASSGQPPAATPASTTPAAAGAGAADMGRGTPGAPALAGGPLPEAGHGAAGATDLTMGGLAAPRSEAGVAIVRQVLGQLPDADHTAQLATAAQLAGGVRLDAAEAGAFAAEIARGLGLDAAGPVDLGNAVILPSADGTRALHFAKSSGAFEVAALDPLALAFMHPASGALLDPLRGRPAFGRYLLWAEAGASRDALASDADLAAIRDAGLVTIGQTRRATVERALGPADRDWAARNLFLGYFLAEWPGYLYVFEFDRGEILRSEGFVADPPPPADAPLAAGMTRDAVWSRLGPPRSTDGWWPFERWRYPLGDGRTDVYEFAHGIVRKRFTA